MKTLELISNFGDGIIKGIQRHDTLLMTVGIIGGVAGTAYLTNKAAMKACVIIEEAEYSSDHKLNRFEKARLVWKIYVPPFAMAVATISLAVGNQIVNMKRYNAAIEAYLLAKSAQEEFETKAEEIVGKNKVEKIKEKVIEGRLEDDSPTDENTELTQYGDTLCYDFVHKRWFKSDIPTLKERFNLLVESFNNGNTKSYYDIFYDIYGITPSTDAEEKVWVPGYTNAPKPTYRSMLTKEGLPCFVIDWDIDRKYILKMESTF